MRELFKFPIVMVDGDNEEKKEKLGLEKEDDIDIIIGEAEVPYFDFVSVCDHWMPTKESFERALEGQFDACGVVFLNSGTFVVPWAKTKFKKELQKFIDNAPLRVTK